MPAPQAESLEALNARLRTDRRRRQDDRLRGHAGTIGERLARDLACFHELPAMPDDACDKQAGRVNSLSLARYRGTDDAVPTAYGHRNHPEMLGNGQNLGRLVLYTIETNCKSLNAGSIPARTSSGLPWDCGAEAAWLRRRDDQAGRSAAEVITRATMP